MVTKQELLEKYVETVYEAMDNGDAAVYGEGLVKLGEAVLMAANICDTLAKEKDRQAKSRAANKALVVIMNHDE